MFSILQSHMQVRMEFHFDVVFPIVVVNTLPFLCTPNILDLVSLIFVGFSVSISKKLSTRSAQPVLPIDLSPLLLLEGQAFDRGPSPTDGVVISLSYLGNGSSQ
jgi:hypothetical protein